MVLIFNHYLIHILRHHIIKCENPVFVHPQTRKTADLLNLNIQNLRHLV